jgi:hypothetical protein
LLKLPPALKLRWSGWLNEISISQSINRKFFKDSGMT